MKIDNRKVLSGIAEVVGHPEKITDICVAIDKIDKIGQEKVCEELLQREISSEAINKIEPFFNFKGSNKEKLDLLKHNFENSTIGLEGVRELEDILNICKELQIEKPEIDITLARGLNYYTGAIFEVKTVGVVMGSISGGGRYDDLTGIFGLKNMSGVGISYGAERIYDVLEEMNLFPQQIGTPVKVIFLNFGETEQLYALKAVQQVRAAGIAAEIYPDKAKIGKQMNYANNKGIPFVVMAGAQEDKSKSLYTEKYGNRRARDIRFGNYN